MRAQPYMTIIEVASTMSDTLLNTTTELVTLTLPAIERVKFLIGKQQNPNLKLRIGVKGGGCSGLSYVMNLEEQSKERDIVYTVGDITVLIDRKAAPFLSGVQLDY